MRRLLLICLTFIGLLLTLSTTIAQSGDERYVGQIDAPAFPTGVDWLNVDAPLTLEGLQGKIVLLDFWTYGCINCIHMIPVLHELEERFADELVVIGVHSGKFEGEQVTENLQQIVQRYEIEHPVINDEDYLVWRTFGAQAWPTFIIIDPNGKVLAAQAGEIPYDVFEVYISQTIEYYDNNPEFGTIDRTPLELALEGAGDPSTALSFPGKVLTDTESNRLFIADTNHHRIVVADLTTYEVLQIVGTGERGFDDGGFDEATFDQPQGMELVGNTLYVADVNNHVIRAIDFDAEVVITVAGTGTISRSVPPFNRVINEPLSENLRSPWDVELSADDKLYIAMAGAHQIWQLDIVADVLRPSVGNGREAQFNTTLANSELAQPSGLHWHEGLLYFADSESSTIRVADFNTNQVFVASGTTENSLFDYGDVDGVAGDSRLQHPLGVTGNEDGSLIFFADTYNNKIKQFDSEAGETTTLFGLVGNGGYQDGDVSEAEFDEPGGLDYANGLLYVADTNNHAIRVIDLNTGLVSTVQFPNPEALVIERAAPTILGGNSSAGIQLELESQTIATGDIDLVLTFNLPDGYKINELTDSTVALAFNDIVQVVDADSSQATITETTTIIPISASAGETTLSLTIELFYCEEDRFCLIDDVQIDVPLVVTDDSDNRIITINREVTLPESLISDG
ncbi:MAG: thioredoxin-like domain-containing protein [Chloroflexota bacterium]